MAKFSNKLTYAMRKRGGAKLKRAHKRFKMSKGIRSVPRNKLSVGAGVGFPKRMTMTHRYRSDTSVTAATGAVAKYVFRVNGMYDPDISGGGHQPAYFDQMTTLYDHYTVIGSKCTVRILPAVTNNVAAAWGLNVNDDDTLSGATYTEIAEQSLSKARYINAGNTNACRGSAKWGVKKFFPGSTLANINLQGTSGANPTEFSSFIVWIQAADGASTIIASLMVEIDYIAVWTELKDIAQS